MVSVNLTWADNSSVEDGFNIYRTSGSSVSLSWTDNSSVEDGYRIYRSTTTNPSFPADYSQIAQLSPNTASYTDSDLPTGGTLSYAVTAYNSGGESGPTTAAIPKFPSDYSQIDSVVSNVTSFTDADAPGNSLVFYSVTAYNQAGESSATTESIETPIPITIDGEYVVGVTIGGDNVDQVGFDGSGLY